MHTALTVALSAVAAVLVVVSPTAAATGAALGDPVDTGSVATCRYRVVDHVPADNPYGESGIGVLRKIVVTPPRMYGLTNWDAPVSWRFVVYKSWDWYHGGTWKLFYKSPQQYGTASTSTPADFTKMMYRPPTPRNDDVDLPSNTSYRVEIRMTWWNPDSPVIFSRLSYLLTENNVVVDNVEYLENLQMCYYRIGFPGL